VATLSELYRLDGRVAIVTGGSRGFGQEMAEGLAEAGASLMLCARRDEWLTPTVAEMRRRGHTVEGAICDAMSPRLDPGWALPGQRTVTVSSHLH